VAWVRPLDLSLSQRLDHREHMAALVRLSTSAEDLTETPVLEYSSERISALLQNLVAMGDEQ